MKVPHESPETPLNLLQKSSTPAPSPAPVAGVVNKDSHVVEVNGKFETRIPDNKLALTLEEQADQLPNLCQTGDGDWVALCCRCDRWVSLYVGIEEIPLDSSYEHYCYGSQSCLP